MTDKSRKVFFDYLSAKLSPTWGDYGTTIIIDELWAAARQAATAEAEAALMPTLVEARDAGCELGHQMREAIMLIKDAPAITEEMEFYLERWQQTLARINATIGDKK